MNRRLAASLLVGASILVAGAGCGSGACVGIGGTLSSPECKQDWDADECVEWDEDQVNGATWTFHAGSTCESLGYTEECSDGSFREPGDC